MDEQSGESEQVIDAGICELGIEKLVTLRFALIRS